jgi:hypothetical protein
MRSFLKPIAKHKGKLSALTVVLAATAAVYSIFFDPMFSSTPPSVTNVTIAMPTRPPTPGDTSTSSCYASTEDGPQSGGWGPERPTYGNDALPTSNTFNVYRDNPKIGDERTFVGIRDAAAAERVWHNRLEMEPGKTYHVRVYVHNGANAAANQVATGVRVSLNLPTCTGHAIALDGFITSDDAFPREVYSKVVVWSRRDFNLAYVADTAVYETNKSPRGGFPLVGASGLFTSKGVLVGYDKLDGRVKGGYEYDGYLMFQIRPQFAA